MLTTWGSTADERARPYPCDSFLASPDAALFRAIDVNAQQDVIFRWLCQLRVAPYSYDLIDNLGRRSPRQLTPGVTDLRVGQSVMTIFTLVGFKSGEHMTLRMDHRLFGEIVCSYVVSPSRGESRLVVKLLVRYRRGPLGLLMRWLLPPGDLVMMRRQLRTLAALAERG
jgi:hypothetical protein